MSELTLTYLKLPLADLRTRCGQPDAEFTPDHLLRVTLELRALATHAATVQEYLQMRYGAAGDRGDAAASEAAERRMAAVCEAIAHRTTSRGM